MIVRVRTARRGPIRCGRLAATTGLAITPETT
jgi:hypothetical protein